MSNFVERFSLTTEKHPAKMRGASLVVYQCEVVRQVPILYHKPGLVHNRPVETVTDFDEISSLLSVVEHQLQPDQLSIQLFFSSLYLRRISGEISEFIQ